MTLQDRDPNPTQLNPEVVVPHSGNLPVDQGGERPVDIFDNTSLLEADVRDYLTVPDVADISTEPAVRQDADSRPQDGTETDDAEANATAQKPKPSMRNRVIATVAGVALVAGGGAVVKNLFFGDQPAAQPIVPVEPAGPNTGENGGGTSVDSAAQLEQTIAARPEAGTPEFEAVVQKYAITGNSPEEVLLSSGHSFYGVIVDAMKDVPKTYHDDHIELSIDEMYENLNPQYWGEVYSVATFGAPSTQLSPDQKVRYDAFMIDLKTAIQQYLLTSNGENPTNIDLSDESVQAGPSTDNLVSGSYSVTMQPNKDNIVSEINPEETQRGTITLSGVFQKNDNTGSWNWVYNN